MVTSTTDALTENGLTLYPELSSLSRLRYFFGQLITQRDLEAEQRYHLVLRRLMQREAFGTGTVAGLRVSEDKDGVTVPQSVFLQPGLAMDPDGRELLLENEECIPVADAPVDPTSTPFDPAHTTKGELVGDVQDRFAQSFSEANLDALVNALTDFGLMTEDEQTAYQSGTIDVIEAFIEYLPDAPAVLDPPQLLWEWIFDQLVGTTHIGLRYRELGMDPSPAVLDASCCGDASCFPSRTREGVYIVTSTEPFPEVPDPHQSYKLCLDTDFFGQMDGGAIDAHVDCKTAMCGCLLDGWRGLPPDDDPCGKLTPPTVCLARIQWSRFTRSDTSGTLPQLVQIDNCGCRPLAPGGPMIRALVESLTGCAAPDALLPRLATIEPEQGKVFNASQTGPTSSTGFKLAATADAIINVDSGIVLDERWRIIMYPADGTNPQVYDNTVSPGPGGNTVSIAFTDPGTGMGGHNIELTFAGGAALTTGTYVWQLLNSPAAFQSTSNSQQLDGEPNPPDAVPSGNGQPGGTFEARFVVVPDPT